MAVPVVARRRRFSGAERYYGQEPHMKDLTSAAASAVNSDLLHSECPQVTLPQYDRDRLIPSVVHLGVGGFHRAHQAVYFDELAARGHTGWGVIGVGVSRPEMRDILDAQDNLYVVVQRGAEASTARLVGSMVDYLLLADDPAAVEERLADPRTRLVTITVTGNGYAVDDSTDEHSSVFGPLAAALDTRRLAGLPPFTVLSCDNLPDAAAAARTATVAMARRRSAELAEWIEGNVCFPASMVDRITPQTSPDQRDEIAEEFAVDDRWPIVTEAFAQWVIEDCFTDGRPPLDTVGAQFVPDVAPYKLIKSRLLNGSHSALGYLGYLAGHRTSAEAMADPQIARFIEHLMRDEVAPGLPADIPGMELDSYQTVLLDRFCSPTIADGLDRLCRRGSTKMADYLLPSLHEAAADGRPYRLLALAVAAWRRYLSGTDLTGAPIDVQDPRLDELQPLAQDSAAALLATSDLFGELGTDDAFVAEVTRLGEVLDRDGVGAAIDEVLGS
jgi:mannitol 2-dehydrogenase